MSIIHEKIEEILLKYGEAQTNLQSKSARKIISSEICKEVLSTSKMALMEENISLKKTIEEIEKLTIAWPPNDVY